MVVAGWTVVLLKTGKFASKYRQQRYHRYYRRQYRREYRRQAVGQTDSIADNWHSRHRRRQASPTWSAASPTSIADTIADEGSPTPPAIILPTGLRFKAPPPHPPALAAELREEVANERKWLELREYERQILVRWREELLARVAALFADMK